jgi:hypothetical protein
MHGLYNLKVFDAFLLFTGEINDRHDIFYLYSKVGSGVISIFLALYTMEYLCTL